MQFQWRKPFYVTLLMETWETWCIWKHATPAQRFVGRGEYDKLSPYPFLV